MFLVDWDMLHDLVLWLLFHLLSLADLLGAVHSLQPVAPRLVADFLSIRWAENETSFLSVKKRCEINYN